METTNYLTEEGKQEIEAKIAELEKFYINARKVGVTLQKIDWEIDYLKKILLSATILPVEEKWEDVKEKYDDPFIGVIIPDDVKKNGAHYLKFRLNEDTGKVNYAPEEDDKSHYNLYKSDDFSLEKIIIVETVKFA